MSYKIVLQAVSPICHGDTTVGINSISNTRVFMRQNQIVNGMPALVPALSENALRNVMIRTPIHDHLIKALEIGEGELPQSVVNLLYSGGSMAAGSKAPSQAMEIGHLVRKIYPSLDLLGGALDGFILPKSRLKVNAWLVCLENKWALNHVAPELVEHADVSAFDMVTEETRTRGTGDTSSGNQMIYTYETLSAGAKIFVELSLDPHTSDVSKSALAKAIECWDLVLGGQSRQGRGRMAILSHDLPSSDTYNDYVKDNKDVLKAGLIDGTLGTKYTLCGA